MNLNETELLKLLFFEKKKKMFALDISIIDKNSSDQCDFLKCSPML